MYSDAIDTLCVTPLKTCTKKGKNSAVCLTQQTGWPLGRSIKLIVDPLRICVKPMSNWC